MLFKLAGFQPAFASRAEIKLERNQIFVFWHSQYAHEKLRRWPYKPSESWE